MHDLMALLQELDSADVKLSQALVPACAASPSGAAAPVAEPEDSSADLAVFEPDGKTLLALKWASGLDDDATVVSLIRALPSQVVEEQIAVYDARDLNAVAEAPKQERKIVLKKDSPWCKRAQVAARFHKYCESRGLVLEKRMPYGAMKTFIQDNIEWRSKQKPPTARHIRKRYKSWRANGSSIAVADDAQTHRSDKCMLKYELFIKEASRPQKTSK